MELVSENTNLLDIGNKAGQIQMFKNIGDKEVLTVDKTKQKEMYRNLPISFQQYPPFSISDSRVRSKNVLWYFFYYNYFLFDTIFFYFLFLETPTANKNPRGYILHRVEFYPSI